MDRLFVSVTAPNEIPLEATQQERDDALSLLRAVQQGEPPYTDTLGWHKSSLWAGEAWLDRYLSLSARIREDADAFVVVGVGGSNQAARATITALRDQCSGPAVFWAGNTLSAYAAEELLKTLEPYRRIYINVIAKNFETLEPGLAFRVLRGLLRSRYPDAWQQHVTVTGTPGGHLEALSRRHGFSFLPFPVEIGGRFSALSPVGLFPMAVAGLDIRRLAQGAADMERQLKTDQSADNPALRYALLRYRLYRMGYRTELLACFEPRMARFLKWWVQLFGESEGKSGLGLFPAAAGYSEDLHSIGQFVQEGTPLLFESFLTFRKKSNSLSLSSDEVDDRFAYLDGMSLDKINRAACKATIAAHASVLPCIEFSLPEVNEYTFGMLFYFFFFSCYLSGRMLGVNPFDQPGVEDYKTRMFRMLGKQ